MYQHTDFDRQFVRQPAATVVLVDATKLHWHDAALELLCHLLRVPGMVFAVNKLDALGCNAQTAFTHISAALEKFPQEAGIEVTTLVPISALKGHNVVESTGGGWLLATDSPAPSRELNVTVAWMDYAPKP